MVRNFIGQVVDGLSNLIRWLPVIWNDRDWDHAFFYRMLAFKLESMEENTRHWITADAEEHRVEIGTAASIARRLEKDAYDHGAFERIAERWGDPFEEMTDHPLGRAVRLRFPGVVTDEDEAALTKMMRDEYLAAQSRRDHDRRALFDLLERHVDTWWD